MPQFSVSDREAVRKRCEKMDWIDETQVCGPGLWLRLQSSTEKVSGFTFLAEQDGWYVDSIDRGHDDLVVVVMPYGAGEV
jgi:hypothetical protein